MNFKGGSGKTTTAIHLAQYLALRGYRVLAVDLDPQASLTAMLGYQPETDIGQDETLMGVINCQFAFKRDPSIASNTGSDAHLMTIGFKRGR
jgi:cellulose biosynthesis protein BcsQ